MKALRLVGCAFLLLGISQVVSCAALFEYPETDSEESAVACSDGIDNDIDGRADCFDPACAIYCQELDEAACGDGLDNDVDGRKDCADSDCKAFCPEGDGATCADGRDNDFDDTTDCDDFDCDGYCPELTASECSDGRDNDGDGQTDAADARCWPLAPPEIQRCGTLPASEFEELFDNPEFGEPWFEPRWYSFGQYVNPQDFTSADVAASGDHEPELTGRYDETATFTLNTTSASTLGENLGGIGTSQTFGGGWQGFDLSFATQVFGGTALRVALVPERLAEAGQPPRSFDSALISVLLDGAANPPVFALEVQGARLSSRLPLPAACGLAFCEDGWARVSVKAEGSKLVARMTSVAGEASVEAEIPVGAAIDDARLVVYGGSISEELFSSIDDLRFSLAAESPCGFQVPQIPSAICAYESAIRGVGRTVSLARNEAGHYCALLGTSKEALTETDAVSAWRSADGLSWLSGPENQEPGAEELAELAVPDAARIVGAAVARDEAEGRWDAVVFHREEDGVRLSTSSSVDCIDWMPLTEGPLLAHDAEAPSYVIGSDQRHVYYTRPPNDQTLRTLWRASGSDPATLTAELAPLTEFSAEAAVAGPVSVQRVGAADLVLSYRTQQISGSTAGGLLVSDEGARDWRPLPGFPELPASGLGAGFDDEEIAALALSFGPEGGIVLYGGLGEQVTAGTALIAPAGSDISSQPTPTAARCGDGTCNGTELCDSCPADCPCPGVTLLDNPFAADSGWQIVSEVFEPEEDCYVDAQAGQLNWGASFQPIWSALALEQPIAGDFELSFDFTMPETASPFCDSAYVGVGTMPTALDYNPQGAFARVTYDSPCFESTIGISAFARTSSGTFSSLGHLGFDYCSIEGAVSVAPSAHRRVILRRERGTVIVRVLTEGSCEETRTVSYLGTAPPLEAVLLGAGGPYDAVNDVWDAECSGAGASISNLQLRLLSDVSDCPGDQVVCSNGTQPSCVDTTSTPEHCGGCFQPCAANLRCEASSCTCAVGLLECGGGCVDPNTSVAHCGACDNACTSYCFLGDCDFGETCDAPRALPPAGGTTTFSFEGRATTFTTLCSYSANSEVVFSWVPDTSGTATIEVQGVTADLDTVLAVSTDPTCATFEALGCNDTGTGLGDGSRVQIPVVAGTTYLVIPAVWGSTPSADTAELRIQVE